MRRIGTVLELWRYPVKSMRGEQLDEAAFDAEGMVGDRRYAVSSTAAPAGKPLLSSRERTAMLLYAPRLTPSPSVTTPAGEELALPSPALLAELQRAVALPGATLRLVASPAVPFTDVRPVALVSAATLRGLGAELGRAVDPQRFRSNLVLALEEDRPFCEDALAGAVLCFGEDGEPGKDGPVLTVLERIPRCRMVSLHPETAAPDPALLPHLARMHEGRVGIYARVQRTGTVRVGAAVWV